jgi:exosortase A-associated hydrolase 1
MTREHFAFGPVDSRRMGSIDQAKGNTGLLIISGGNEIRSGAHSGMARLAHSLAVSGFPVMRFDRAGIGDSSGENTGFLGSQSDIEAALKEFRQRCPNVQQFVIFGNCDAATAAVLFHSALGCTALILANPWTIENPGGKLAKNLPPPAAVRARYWQKLSDPRALWELLTGKLDYRMLIRGLLHAASPADVGSQLASEFCRAALAFEGPITILLAEKDNTAVEFLTHWKSAAFAKLRVKPGVNLQVCNTSSHGFAKPEDHVWLNDVIVAKLQIIANEEGRRAVSTQHT